MILYLSKDKITIFKSRQAAARNKMINLSTVPMADRKEIVTLQRHIGEKTKTTHLFNGMISEGLEKFT